MPRHAPPAVWARLGRFVADQQGVHCNKWLGVFGRTFSLSWSSILSWATCEQALVSREHPEGRVLARIIELRHADGLEHIRWGRSEEAFNAFVHQLEKSLPGKRTASQLQHLSSNEHIPR